MYLVLIFTPLLASILSGFFGRKLGVSGVQWITCSSVVITTLLSIVVFFEVAINNIPVTFELFTWIDSESLNILWGFNFDALTASMLIPVLIVSSLVHIYSIGYMSHDPHNQRFFSYLSLFTFMMIILVTANNYLLMFVGWEGVGVCSYLLVSFWFTRIAANQSSISAFLTNRVGDCFLTLGLFAILWTFGNIDYTTVFSLSPYISENIISLIGICLLIGAMAKSSQIGLHVWLPMAMEGPTPVSALIHAATMVTAGVYLLMRSSPLIEYSSTVLLLCLWIGGLTTVFSSLIGLFQQDIKKVIAYSTMSQLGMMVIAIGLSSYNIALFHLVNHAFYKGLLFLGAGSVIHAVADNQDFRRYGGLRAFLPLTYSVMLIASLSLVAFPYMTGFYSKDLILESAYGQFYFSSVVIYFIAVIGAIFTTLYSVKVLYLTFLTNPNGPIVSYKHAHEGDIFMSLPLIILALFSIFFGYITKDLFIGLGTSLFQDNSIFIYPLHEILIETEFAVPTFFKLLPLFFTLFLTFISIICSEFLPNLLIRFKFTRLGYNLFGFFNQRLLVELFYNTYIIDVILKLGGQTTKVIDKGVIEYIGPYGLELSLTNLSRNIHKLDFNVITNYALYILSGLIFYILITYFNLSVTHTLVYCELFILLAFCVFSLFYFINTIAKLTEENSVTVYPIIYYKVKAGNEWESLVVISLIHGVEVNYEKIITGAAAITSVLVVLGGRYIFKNKEKIKTEVKKANFIVHIQPIGVTWPRLGNTDSYLAIIDLFDPTGANLKVLYGNMNQYPSLVLVTIIRQGVPTVAIVDRATKWSPTIINWNLMPLWAIELRLQTVGHLGYNPGTTYRFPAPSLPIWHSLINTCDKVQISTGCLNDLNVPIGAWCLAHPHGIGVHAPYGIRSFNFVPVLLLPQSVYTHPVSNSMYIDYYSQRELEIFDVVSFPA